MTQKDEDYESLVIEGMMVARTHAMKLFGAECNFFAIHRLYEYLSSTDDEAELLDDIERAVAHVRELTGQAAKPEDVFLLFKTIYEDA